MIKFNGEKEGEGVPTFGVPTGYDPISAAPAEENPVQKMPEPVYAPPMYARVVTRIICYCGHPDCREGPFREIREYA
jgi:hypothetical protein